MNRKKRFRKSFRFREDIREKTCVCVVVDYADMMPVRLLTARTLCQRSQQLSA